MCTTRLQVLATLFSAIVPEAIQLVRRQLKETVATCNHNLVVSCFNLMDALLLQYTGQEGNEWRCTQAKTSGALEETPLTSTDLARCCTGRFTCVQLHCRLSLHPGTQNDVQLSAHTCIMHTCCTAGLPPSPDCLAALPQALPSLMIFAICWSLGASCDKSGRDLFDAFIRSRVSGLVKAQKLPEGAMMPGSAPVYDWSFDTKVTTHSALTLQNSKHAYHHACEAATLTCGAACYFPLQAQAWVPWLQTVPAFKCDPTKPFSQIIVPTADTVRYTFVVDALLAAGKHVLCVGDTGTGKTLTLMTKLLEGMPAEVQPVFLTFSARTSANQTQDIIGEWAVSALSAASASDYSGSCLEPMACSSSKETATPCLSAHG